MAKAGKRSRLAELHAMFTEALISELVEASQGDTPIPLPAADKSVIAKFLKDNDITADADDVAMQELRDTFADDLAKKREERAKAIMQKATGTDDLEGIIG